MAQVRDLKVLSREDIFSGRAEWRKPGGSKYFSMYSSVFGGIVKDPELMVVPLDDHMVHRGDGIFEAFKCVDGSIYNLEAHLKRLQRSAESISLELPFDINTIKELIIRTVAAGGVRDCLVRLFVSRGLGGFDCDPQECDRSHLYVVVLEAWKAPEYYYRRGVSAITSKIPVKPDFFSRVKSLNYLPNVLVDMEAEKEGVDFGITLDSEGNIAEGATENVAIVDTNSTLVYPEFEHILRGTTLLRGVELGKGLVEAGDLKAVSQRKISQQEAYQAKEMLIFGTGPDVISVISYDGKKIGAGKPGPISKKLKKLFAEDIKENKKMLTPVFEE